MARTDTSSNLLTFDGISQYNTNVSIPSWATNVNPTPSNWRSASKFQVTASYPLTTNAKASSCMNNVTIQGFSFIRNPDGQIINLTYMGNLTVQYVEASSTSHGSLGPGVYVGPANNGPGCGGSGPNNVSFLNNYVHDTFG